MNPGYDSRVKGRLVIRIVGADDDETEVTEDEDDMLFS
jgi:hypothetical protein